MKQKSFIVLFALVGLTALALAINVPEPKAGFATNASRQDIVEWRLSQALDIVHE